MNSKCGTQRKRRCKSQESCVCIVGFSACGYVYILFTCITHMLKIQQYKHKTHGFRTFSCFGPIYVEREREREYKKKSKHVLVWKLLLQMFAHLEAFFKACLVGLIDSCKAQFDYKIRHIFAHDIHSR